MPIMKNNIDVQDSFEQWKIEMSRKFLHRSIFGSEMFDKILGRDGNENNQSVSKVYFTVYIIHSWDL